MKVGDRVVYIGGERKDHLMMYPKTGSIVVLSGTHLHLVFGFSFFVKDYEVALDGMKQVFPPEAFRELDDQYLQIELEAIEEEINKLSEI